MVIREAPLAATVQGVAETLPVSFKLVDAEAEKGTSTMLPTTVPLTPFAMRGRDDAGTFSAEYAIKLRVKKPHREPVTSVPLKLRLTAAGAPIPDYRPKAGGGTADSQPSGAA